MIRAIRHKGLARFYATGSIAGIRPDHEKRLRMLLAALDTALTIGDMDVPGFPLHRLKGKAAERWSVRVSGNWRLTFEFNDGQAQLVDYEDYH